MACALLTGVSPHDPYCFDRWDGRMDELYEAKAIDVYSGRWRRNLQKAVAELQGCACLQLLRMVGLLPE